MRIPTSSTASLLSQPKLSGSVSAPHGTLVEVTTDPKLLRKLGWNKLIWLGIWAWSMSFLNCYFVFWYIN